MVADSGFAALFGSAEHIAVDRGLSEFRSGRPILIANTGRTELVMPVDGMDDARLASFRQVCAPAAPYLAVTARRACALGLAASGPVGLAIGDEESAAAILALAADADPKRVPALLPPSAAAAAAIDLAKLAHRLPALLMADGGTARKSAGNFSWSR